MDTRYLSYLFYILVLMIFLNSCGGKMVNTGVGSIMDVNDYGTFRFAYPDGSQSWKRFNQDSVNKDIKVAQQNRLKPTRFVETPKGGTLTFPDGKTILYYDNKAIE